MFAIWGLLQLVGCVHCNPEVLESDEGKCWSVGYRCLARSIEFLAIISKLGQDST